MTLPTKLDEHWTCSRDPFYVKFFSHKYIKYASFCLQCALAEGKVSASYSLYGLDLEYESALYRLTQAWPHSVSWDSTSSWFKRVVKGDLFWFAGAWRARVAFITRRTTVLYVRLPFSIGLFVGHTRACVLTQYTCTVFLYLCTFYLYWPQKK